MDLTKFKVKYAIKLDYGSDDCYYYNPYEGTFSRSPVLFDTVGEAQEVLRENFSSPDTKWKVIKFYYYEEDI